MNLARAKDVFRGLEISYDSGLQTPSAAEPVAKRVAVASGSSWSPKLLIGLAFGALWFVCCRHLSAEWSFNEQYNYGWFVPFFAAYLFWLRWEDRPDVKVESRNSKVEIPAILLIVVSALILLPLRVFEIGSADWRPLGWVHVAAAASITLSILYLLGGPSWLRHFSFPVLFFFVAVPWITPIEEPIVQGLMRVVAASAAEVLAVLLHDIGKPPTRSFDPADQRIRFNGHDRVGAEMAEAVMTRLRFPRHEIDLVVDAVRNHMVFKDVQQMRPARLRRFMARPYFGIELELHRVDCAGSHGDLENYHFLVRKASEFAQEPLIPSPLVRGDDLISMGLQPGPRIGELLEAVQTAQLEGEVTTRAQALEWLQKAVRGD